MSKKIGRNDPCPCGSGKKYKKCCGLSQTHGGFVHTPESWFPPSARTGTLWDDYMEVIPIIATYGKKIMDFDEDGPEFKRAVSDFEKQFRPGEKEGITDSFFMSWMYFSSSIKAFHLGKISKGKLAEYVGENYSEIPSFLKRYGYDENEDYSVEYRTT